MDLPSFSSDALSSLTRKIESNLQKPVNGEAKVPSIQTPHITKKSERGLQGGQSWKHGGGSQGKKRLRDGQLKDLGTRIMGKGHINNGTGKSKEKDTEALKMHDVNKTSKQSTPHELQSNGRKSMADGLIAKDRQRSKNQRDKSDKINTTNSVQIRPSKSSLSRPSIQDEILALSGTEEDLELIEAIVSESEVEGSQGSAPKNLNDRLRRELKVLVRDLGIPEAEVEDIAVISDENEARKTEQASNSEELLLLSGKTEAKSGLKGTPSLVFEPQAAWHVAQLPSLPTSTQPNPSLSKDSVDRLHRYAKTLLENENRTYVLRNGASSSAHQFYTTIMSSGTLSDKISALTLSVQESPVHNVKALETLVNLAKKRSRGQAVEVLGALKDLLGPGGLLPSDRKLRAFTAQPMLSRVLQPSSTSSKKGASLSSLSKDVYLTVWAYEDWLKSTYFDILKIIETWCNDEVVFARGKAVDYVYELLRDKPEQEANLLRLLVNKLGDSDKKIASKTSYNILQLEISHPLMKPTIISAIESDLLFRPGQSLHAKYYAIITLNQTVLSGKEQDVTKKLLAIYFALFSNLLAKPEAANSKSSTTELTTLNRKGEKQGGGGAAGKKAMKKRELESKSLTVDEDLQEKLLSAVLTGVNRAVPFTKTDDEFFGSHLDTLFRVTHSSNFNTSIRALMLIQQLCESNQTSSDRFYRTLYESLLDPRLLTSSKQAMYLNLLFRALRADVKIKRVKAFAKRLLQVVALHQASFTCGVIYLLRELEGMFANLQAFIDQPEEDEDKEAEDFRDVREEGENDQPARAIAIQKMSREHSGGYDGKKREPEYSNADKSCLWELNPFLMHFHPSVSLFASKLLTHQPMPAKPDLSMHTLIQFLDRFVYRNPKKMAIGARGSSIMQPLAGGDTSGLLVTARSKNGLRAPVNTEAFWKMEGRKVDVAEVFFHNYFNAIGRGREQAKMKSKKQTQQRVENAGTDGDEEGQEDEEEIWKALVDSRPEIGGSDLSDTDVGYDELEAELAEGEDEVALTGDTGDGVHGNSTSDEGSEAMDLGEDDDALLNSDEEIDSGLGETFNDEVQSVSKKCNAEPVEGQNLKKRRRLKNLPTFASVDDYAAMLDGDEGDG